MSEDAGWRMRADILRRDADAKLVTPLRQHGWQASITTTERDGEYAIVLAERNGRQRCLALLYSSATDNKIYCRLEKQVDLILFNGRPYLLEQFTRGIQCPVLPSESFQRHLFEWNRDSEPGRLAEDAGSKLLSVEPAPHRPRVRHLLSETPIDAIWLRLARLKSATLARQAIAQRAAVAGIELTDEEAAAKGDGVAYAIRNAADYFNVKDAGNLSQRVLNLYYGCISFVVAEMLAAPRGQTRLEQVEGITRQGHGLWNLDQDGGFGTFSIGPLQSGLFSAWMATVSSLALTVVAKKPRKAADLAAAPSTAWATMEQLFARIPEIVDLYEDVFPGRPACVSVLPDAEANGLGGFPLSGERPKTTYLLLVDDAGRMTAEDVALLRGPLREIRAMPSETRAHCFRAAVDHPDVEHWWEVLDAHRSPFKRSALILPVFGCLDQYRAVCAATLYGLSIIVRYRPSLWRQIQEGHLDHLRILVEAFLVAVERILPEQFLETIAGEQISIHQPGSFFS